VREGEIPKGLNQVVDGVLRMSRKATFAPSLAFVTMGGFLWYVSSAWTATAEGLVGIGLAMMSASVGRIVDRLVFPADEANHTRGRRVLKKSTRRQLRRGPTKLLK
jgi:hypothetical protein